MPDSPNTLSQFWQELKRRKVIRVITVYAAASFVILQLVEILAPSLRLPEWTMNLILVLLVVGFIIAVILSWIFDVHPEEGIVKTEPSQKVKAEDIPKSSNSWKIASYISFVVIVGLIVVNIIPRTNSSKEAEILDKSITVLPFISLSDDPEKQYLADGIMDAILLHLSKIEELRVLARTTSEKYRDTDKTATEICQELGVSFALEGSFRKYGDQARLTVQLIRSGKEDHAWAKQYDREWKEIFAVESEVAQAIAKELQAVITPEEKQLIEKTPTTNLTAYDFYQRGREEYWKYRSDNDNREALERAEELYHEALKLDSKFALAYSELAMVYRGKHYWETYFTDEFLDSVLILTDIALSYDDQLSEAYTVRGDYYRVKGFTELAIGEYDKAIKFNPNDWMAYWGRGRMYLDEDLVKSLANLQKAISLNHGSELPLLLQGIGLTYYFGGFIEKGNNYFEDAFKLDGNSVRYYSYLALSEMNRDNYAKCIEICKKGYAIDSTNSGILVSLGKSYMFLGQFEESLKYFKKYIERLEELGNFDLKDMAEIGYVYSLNGYKEKADYYLDEQINYSNKSIELGRDFAKNLYSHYDLAAVYAFRGEKDKAYENLRIFNQRKMMLHWAVSLIKNDPLLDNIRDEPEFQQIIRDIEAKYQAEHERVRKWLGENDML